MHYLLDKTKIENNLTLFFLKRYAARKLKISPRDQQHPSLSQMVLSVNHWSFSPINHMSTKITQLGQLECAWSQLVEDFVLQRSCQPA